MLFPSQHVALLALSGLRAYAVAQAPGDQTHATQATQASVETSDPLSINQAGWKKEDNLAIVPLHPKARTGLIDPVLEEGLISMGTVTNPEQRPFG
jgi:hypothetical protein